MTIYLGLGSNDGERRQHLERAIEALVAAGFRLQQVSPVVESPALLPPCAEPDWHKPYLNLALSGDAEWQPQQGLAIAKQIEKDLGRPPGAKWSPRPIDIDLLRWHEHALHTETLTIPHADACQRDFVLTPLLHLQPDLALGANGESVFALSQRVRPIPLWMAIVNLTPDSFSDGNRWADADELNNYLEQLIADNVHIIDIGAESTRPGAEVLSHEHEWARLEPTLARLAERLHGRHLKPCVSLDSRNPANVEKALRYGVEMVNDVTGLSDPDMIALVRDNGCQVVAMHSLTVPTDPSVVLSPERSAIDHLRDWVEQKMEIWSKAGLDLNRIILDPGIGFGKSATQAIELLSHCRELRRAGLRVLIGHSRKSFMRRLHACDQTQHDQTRHEKTSHDHATTERDLDTVGMSLSLCQQGVDIIRVHAPALHQCAYLAWAHVAPPSTPDSAPK